MWRIYYADGTTFDYLQGSPADAPGRGAICIVQSDPDVGRHVLDRFDFYWWRDGQWWGGERYGLDEYLSEPGWKSVKYGRTISNEEFRRIKRLAESDPDFAARSARSLLERPFHDPC